MNNKQDEYSHARFSNSFYPKFTFVSWGVMGYFGLRYLIKYAIQPGDPYILGASIASLAGAGLVGLICAEHRGMAAHAFKHRIEIRANPSTYPFEHVNKVVIHDKKNA